MESPSGPPEKKQKIEDDLFVQSPDLFESESIIEDDVFMSCENDASIPLAQGGGHGNEVPHDNVAFQSPLVSEPNEQQTPPNPFSSSCGFYSERINIQEIIAALVSQPTQQIEQQPQSQPPPQQQQQEQKVEHQQQHEQQQQPENDLPPNSPENLPVEKLIEELSSSHKRIIKLLGEVKESS